MSEYEMMGEYQQAIADWKSDYDTLLKKLYEKDEKIAELERRNELLRSVVGEVRENIRMFNETGNPWGFPSDELTTSVEAAIDGGALDGEK